MLHCGVTLGHAAGDSKRLAATCALKPPPFLAWSVFEKVSAALNSPEAKQDRSKVGLVALRILRRPL